MRKLPTSCAVPRLPRASHLALAVLFTASASCALAVQDGPDVPDPITVDAPLVRCWIESTGLADRDELHCRYRPESAAPVSLSWVDLSIGLATEDRSFRLEEASEDTVVASLDEDAYPLELSIQLVYGETQEVLGIETLGQNTVRFAIEQAEDVARDTPVSVALPFSLWDLTLRNRYERSARLRFRHGLPLEPAGHIAEADIECASFGYQETRVLAVPLGAEEVSAALRLDDQVAEVVLNGPGTYEISSDGHMERTTDRIPLDGLSTASCWIEDGRSKAHRLVCAHSPHPGLEAVTLDLRTSDGDIAVLPLNEGLAERELSALAFPLSITVRSRVADSIKGLGPLEGSSHRQELRIESEEAATISAPREAALPVQLWAVSLQGDEDLRDFALDVLPTVIELGTAWRGRFALKTWAQRTPGVAPGDSTSFVVAVSPGRRSIEARGFVVQLDGTRLEQRLLLRAGSWRATRSGISKSD